MKKNYFIILIAFMFFVLPQSVGAVARDVFPSAKPTQSIPHDTKPNISANVQNTDAVVAPGIIIQEPKATDSESMPSKTTDGAKKSSHAWIWWTLGGIILIVGFGAYMMKDRDAQ